MHCVEGSSTSVDISNLLSQNDTSHVALQYRRVFPHSSTLIVELRKPKDLVSGVKVCLLTSVVMRTPDEFPLSIF